LRTLLTQDSTATGMLRNATYPWLVARLTHRKRV